LAKFEDEAILVKQGHHMAATFHPELTSDGAIHRYFLKMLKE
jgi:5'-phosphate synthase pdxT subunit